MGSIIQTDFVALVIVLADGKVYHEVCQDKAEATSILNTDWNLGEKDKYFLFPFTIGLDYLWMIEEG